MNPEAAIMAAVVRRKLLAAVVKEDGAWAALLEKLKRAYTRAFDAQAQDALARALERLRKAADDADPLELEAAIMAALEKDIGPDALKAVLRRPVMDLTEALFGVGAAEIGLSAGVDIVFGAPDLDALAMIQDANLFWIENSWNAYVDGLFRAALSDYFKDGMTRAQLTKRFAEDFAGLTERGIHYFELLADHTATRVREMGRTTGYQRAGVEYVQVRAHLDNNTTEICRRMNGKIVPVSKLADQRAAYLDAVSQRNVEAAKAAWTMHGDKSDLDALDGDVLPAGTACPPYHFRCRTVTVIYRKP